MSTKEIKRSELNNYIKKYASKSKNIQVIDLRSAKTPWKNL